MSPTPIKTTYAKCQGIPVDDATFERLIDLLKDALKAGNTDETERLNGLLDKMHHLREQSS